MKMDSITCIFLSVLNVVSCGIVQAQTHKVRKPNIILFLIDDMGWQDTSVPFWKQKTNLNEIYRTPNMEALASMGVKFTNAYACPVCSPTRVSLLTGVNSARHQVTNSVLRKDVAPDKTHPSLDLPKWNVNGLSSHPGIENTCYFKPLPEFLHEAGYYTIHVGKAHWGAQGTPGENPLNLGFDLNIAGHAAGSPGSYYGSHNFSDYLVTGSRTRDVPGLEKYFGKDIYLTEALTLEAITAINQAVSKENPFFLYMAHYGVHAPFEKDDRFYQKYIDAGLSQFDASYASMIEGIDKSLGDIMRELKKLDIEDKTIIIFTSDNGASKLVRNNYPLRGCKETPFEGGIRVPMLVFWPGVTVQNATCNTPVIIDDLFPSVLEMAGINNYSQVGGKIDGKSFVPLLKGKPDKDTSRQFVWHYPHFRETEPFSVIRKGDWKLIFWYKDKKRELYNLKDDISETNDLSTVNIHETKELSKELANYLRKVNAGRPSYKDSGRKCNWPDELNR
jgi:arylsulfatase A-like enzyme